MKVIYNEGRVVGLSSYSLYVRQLMSLNPEATPMSEREWLASTISESSSLILRVPGGTPKGVVDIPLPENSSLCGASVLYASVFQGEVTLDESGYWAKEVEDYGELISNTYDLHPVTPGMSGDVPTKNPPDPNPKWLKDRCTNYTRIKAGLMIQPGKWLDNIYEEELEDERERDVVTPDSNDELIATLAEVKADKTLEPDFTKNGFIRLLLSEDIHVDVLILIHGFADKAILESGISIMRHGVSTRPEDGDFLGPSMFPWACPIYFMATDDVFSAWDERILQMGSFFYLKYTTNLVNEQVDDLLTEDGEEIIVDLYDTLTNMWIENGEPYTEPEPPSPEPPGPEPPSPEPEVEIYRIIADDSTENVLLVVFGRGIDENTEVVWIIRFDEGTIKHTHSAGAFAELNDNMTELYYNSRIVDVRVIVKDVISDVYRVKGAEPEPQPVPEITNIIADDSSETVTLIIIGKNIHAGTSVFWKLNMQDVISEISAMGEILHLNDAMSNEYRNSEVVTAQVTAGGVTSDVYTVKDDTPEPPGPEPPTGPTITDIIADESTDNVVIIALGTNIGTETQMTWNLTLDGTVTELTETGVFLTLDGELEAAYRSAYYATASVVIEEYTSDTYILKQPVPPEIEDIVADESGDNVVLSILGTGIDETTRVDWDLTFDGEEVVLGGDGPQLELSLDLTTKFNESETVIARVTVRSFVSSKYAVKGELPPAPVVTNITADDLSELVTLTITGSNIGADEQVKWSVTIDGEESIIEGTGMTASLGEELSPVYKSAYTATAQVFIDDYTSDIYILKNIPRPDVTNITADDSGENVVLNLEGSGIDDQTSVDWAVTIETESTDVYEESATGLSLELGPDQSEAFRAAYRVTVQVSIKDYTSAIYEVKLVEPEVTNITAEDTGETIELTIEGSGIKETDPVVWNLTTDGEEVVFDDSGLTATLSGPAYEQFHNAYSITAYVEVDGYTSDSYTLKDEPQPVPEPEVTNIEAFDVGESVSLVITGTNIDEETPVTWSLDMDGELSVFDDSGLTTVLGGEAQEAFRNASTVTAQVAIREYESATYTVKNITPPPVPEPEVDDITVDDTGEFVELTISGSNIEEDTSVNWVIDMDGTSSTIEDSGLTTLLDNTATAEFRAAYLVTVQVKIGDYTSDVFTVKNIPHPTPEPEVTNITADESGEFVNLVIEGNNIEPETSVNWFLTMGGEATELPGTGLMLTLDRSTSDEYLASETASAYVAIGSYESDVFTLKSQEPDPEPEPEPDPEVNPEEGE